MLIYTYSLNCINNDASYLYIVVLICNLSAALIAMYLAIMNRQVVTVHTIMTLLAIVNIMYPNMWPYLWKEVLYTHSFKSHFSPQFDRYNDRLTVHAHTIAKDSTVYFYWDLIYGPVWHPRVLVWSVNGSNYFPSQADSQQGITTRLAGVTEHRCSYILWYVEPKTA